MTKCSIEGCETKAKYAGLCGLHYKRKWRHGDPLKTHTPNRGFERVRCSAVDLCDRDSEYSNGLCERHYQMWRVYGRTYRINNESGQGSINSAGYVVHTVSGKRVYEHVLLAEKALGKPLPEGAVVHHMNNNPQDNFTPLNLIVCPDQTYHLLLHRRAKELGYETNQD